MVLGGEGDELGGEGDELGDEGDGLAVEGVGLGGGGGGSVPSPGVCPLSSLGTAIPASPSICCEVWLCTPLTSAECPRWLAWPIRCPPQIQPSLTHSFCPRVGSHVPIVCYTPFTYTDFSNEFLRIA